MAQATHHYHQNPSLNLEEIGELDSIRGKIKLYQTNSFTTKTQHHSFVPVWPKVQDVEIAETLADQLQRDSARAKRMMLEIGIGPYWQGKGLQRISQLMNVAHAEGQSEITARLLQTIQKRAEQWLKGDDASTYFYYDKPTGTLVAYPEEYDAVRDMNDHHFHYGYWIRSAGDIGLQDKAWISQEKFGGMIDFLVEDIATTTRGIAEFPYLHNFDPYEGHSWASGVGRGDRGNNQEASSEAINAWTGLIV